MSREIWTEVDRYFTGALERPDPVLAAALEASEAAGLPAYQVSAAQGRFLWMLASSMRAASILEIGTLGGYSTIWLARALPAGGKLITLESDPKHAAVARTNLARAGLDDRVELRVGKALETLPSLSGERFDFFFVDADKPSNTEYFEHALALSRPGSVIVIDNVVRAGRVIDERDSDPNVAGVRRLVDRVRNEPRVDATVMQTVGDKGHDGFLIALVRG